MQRISHLTQQTQERTTQARGFISALNQSCEPWQRLAAVDPGPDSASRPAGAGLQLPEGLPPLGAGLMTPALFGSSRTISSPSIRSPHGSSKVRQNPGRKGVGSEHSR